MINNKQSFLICLILTLLTLAVYLQVKNFDFVNYDDNTYVYENSNIHNGLSVESVKWAFTTGYANFWHPLTWLSHILDWQLYGSNPAGHHLTNLLFHILNTLLLFIVFKKLTNEIWQSVFAAALFAVHPLHVESVAWISERKDLLSTFLAILTLLAYLRYVKHKGFLNYIFSLSIFVFGLMAKPMLVTLPFVFLLLDYWPLCRIKKFEWKISKYLLFEKIPFIILSIFFSFIAFYMQQRGGAIPAESAIPLKFRVLNAFISYSTYIKKMFWPSRLAVFYPHPGQKVSMLYAVISAVILLAITLFVFRFAKKHRYLVTGWFWYIGTLLPVIGLIQVGNHAMADRYSYIPLIGLFIIIAWGADELMFKLPYKKISSAFISLLIISALSVCSYFQIGRWSDSLNLFSHALDVTNNNYVAHTNMGMALYELKRMDEAEFHYAQASLIEPDSHLAHIRLASILYQAGKLNESACEYETALRIKPNNPKVLNELGIIFGRQAKLEDSKRYFKNAIQIDPNFMEAYINIAAVLMIQNKIDEAAEYLNELLKLNSSSARAYFYLGQIFLQKNNSERAIEHFIMAFNYEPNNLEYMNTMAWHLAVNRTNKNYNPDKALALALKVNELTNYVKPEFLDTLAAAYAATGDFSKAVEIEQNALKLCVHTSQEKLKKEIEERMVKYRKKQNYIEK